MHARRPRRAIDWRRRCRASLWDSGTLLLVTAPSGGLVLGPVCCGSLPLWAFLNYELGFSSRNNWWKTAQVAHCEIARQQAGVLHSPSVRSEGQR